jgi:hypothetical protein
MGSRGKQRHKGSPPTEPFGRARSYRSIQQSLPIAKAAYLLAIVPFCSKAEPRGKPHQLGWPQREPERPRTEGSGALSFGIIGAGRPLARSEWRAFLGCRTRL